MIRINFIKLLLTKKLRAITMNAIIVIIPRVEYPYLVNIFLSAHHIEQVVGIMPNFGRCGKFVRID